MNTTLAVLLIALICFMAVYLTAHWCKKLQDQNKELKAEVEKQQQTIVDMYKHAEELAQIHQDKSEVDQKINEAKTNEEISEIINGIIAANNSKLRK